MTVFLLRRAAWFAVTLWVVVSLSFLLMRAVPGGPFDGERALHPAVERSVQARYHLDWPLWKQYLHYVGPLNLDERGVLGDKSRIFGGALTGDLGPSYRIRDYSVSEIIGQSLPISILLGSLALGWAIVAGVAAGIVSALHAGRAVDSAARFVATLGLALPNFVIAGLLVLLFSLTWRLTPVAGWGEPRHVVLPAIALGAPFAAYIARLARTGLLDALREDYVRTAVAKGLPRRLVVTRHALRSGLLPVISYLGPAAAGVLTGSLVIEKIFHVPGTGSHFVNSALNRDYTLALGVTILYTVLVYGLNTLVDVAYALLDPRVELE